MAGKGYTGVQTNNAGNSNSSRAFCEGMEHRALGTAVAFPVTDNPHIATSEDGVAWIAGWTVANTAAPGAITATNAPNCAVPAGVISA